jgi:hypothetical protein
MRNLSTIFFILLSSFIFLFTDYSNAEVNQTFSTSNLKNDDLKRNYWDSKYSEYGDIVPYCPYHLVRRQMCWENDVIYDAEVNRLLHLIPLIEYRCNDCAQNTIYTGYFDSCIGRYFYHFHHYLTNYCSTHTECHCYWPELSPLAAQINNLAYDLFEDLFFSTVLFKKSFYENGFCDNAEGSRVKTEDYNYDPEGYDDYYDFGCCNTLERFFPAMHDQDFHHTAVIASFICHSFHYSDYLDVCRDLYSYCKRNYNEEDCIEIKHKMDDLLEKLAPPFLDLYNHCLAKHPNAHIKKERLIVLSRLGLFDYSFFKILKLDKSQHFDFKNALDNALVSNYFFNKNEILVNKISSFCPNLLNDNQINMDQCDYKKPNPILLEAEYLLSQGIILNNLLLHKEAIEALTKSIELDSYDKRALLERAAAYFETNQIELALKDYEAIKRLILPPFKDGNHLIFEMEIYVPKNKIDFAEGLLSGIISGGKIGAEDFFPSLYSSIRGLQKAFWGMHLSPIETSKEIIDAAYAVGNFISSKTETECLECVIPELKELSLTWNEIGDKEKGRKIGFIIGKYGIDILIPCIAVKGVNTFKALKYANTMCTLECCAQSKLKQLKILEASSKHAALRETFIIESVKKGKILVKSSNVQYHVMQKKHAWDKLIKLTGMVEEDFRAVVLLLEDNCILSEKFVLASENFAQGKIIRTDYKKMINGLEVRATFERYVETNQIFLKDAWVSTKL